MDKLSLLVIVLNICCVYGAVNITELRGPDSIKYGTTEDVILDCDFQADNESKNDLVIKYYYNSDSNMIYQWIPKSNNSVFAVGIFKDHIDVTYTATNDPHTKHRALRITNITKDLTGNYSCKVSSFKGEDMETKQLIIYNVPESPMSLFVSENEQEVICTAYGIFPKPDVNLYILSKNSTKLDVEEITVNNTEEYQEDDDGFYNITKVYKFPNLTSFSSNLKFGCDLTIPGTDFLLSEYFTYQSDNSGITCASTLSSIILAIVFLILSK